MKNVPNPDRWNAWVIFTWVLAGLACLTGVVLIIQFGYVEIGNNVVIKPIIWGIGIGQAISAIIIAVLFSMINSIYKKSCGMIFNKMQNLKLEDDKNSDSLNGRHLSDK